jgi:signal recognition particle subunit SRP54
MFENLTGRLSEATRSISGKGRLTEANIKDTLRQVRLALLEADVALPVVKTFIDRVRERAVGEEVARSLTPGQALVKIIHNELVAILGGDHAPLNLKAQPPVVILLAGLQGAGKTTSAAKLARRIMEKDKKRVMLVSVDVHRPAAILQLKTLAGEVGALHCDSDPVEAPVAIVERALDEARRSHADVLIVDTAGRLHIDSGMMEEVKSVHKAAAPQETLFVVDSMAGQDAVNAAAAFSEALPLSGVFLTKADGDAVLRSRFAKLQASRSDSSVSAKKWTASRRFIRSGWLRASSAWAMSCRWSKRSRTRSAGKRPKSSPKS